MWGHCPSGRFFEATACGTPVVTDEWKGLEEFFNVKEELVVVQDSADGCRAIHLSDTELLRIAARSRAHTGRHRAQQLLHYCEEAGAAKGPAMEVAS